MLLTSSWFLLITRTALPQVGQTTLSLLILTTIWLHYTKKRKLAVVSAAISIGLLLYIPGAVWLIIIGIVWKRKQILDYARSVPFWYALMALVLAIIICIPALLQINDKSFILRLVAIPSYMITPKQFILNIYYFFGSVLWNSTYDLTMSIGKQGLLDVFTICMLIAGLYSGFRNRHRGKYKYIFGATLVGLLLIGLGGSVTSAFILPYLFLLVAAGLAWVLQQWFAVFPKNPVARNTGVALLMIAVSFSVVYNSYRYFIAWPHMDDTKISYNLRP